MNLTGLWSYTLPSNTTYQSHLDEIKTHINKTFNNEALFIDEALLTRTLNQNDQTALNPMHSDILPEQLRIHLQQSQYGNIPAWLQSHNRTLKIWKQKEPTIAGKGGGVLTSKTAKLPHHKQWLHQQTQYANPLMPVTCQLPILTDELYSTFYTTYLSNDNDNVFMTIPYCPDTTMLNQLHRSTDIGDLKVLTTNLLRQNELTMNTILPLDQIENYIRTVTASLGGELVRYDKTMLQVLQLDEFRSIPLQTFTIHKDIYIYLPGNNIIISFGRIQTDNRLTNTIICEIELNGVNMMDVDPLVFHHIFNLIHPYSSIMLWKYANTPFGPSRTYTFHDLCTTMEQIEHLKIIYGQFLTLPTSPLPLVPTLRPDYTYPKRNNITTTAAATTSNATNTNSNSIINVNNNNNVNTTITTTTTTPKNTNQTTTNITKRNNQLDVLIDKNSQNVYNKDDINIIPSDVAMIQQQEQQQPNTTLTTDQVNSALHLLDQRNNVIAHNALDSDQYHLNKPDHVLNTIHNTNTSSSSSGAQLQPIDFIQGVCILPQMTSLFVQYRLTQTTFHPEHLALMYTQLFLHPHETAQ